MPKGLSFSFLPEENILEELLPMKEADFLGLGEY
jgi:hypothetical protein